MAGLSSSATADVSILEAMLVAKRKAAEASAARDAGVVAQDGAEAARDGAVTARSIAEQKATAADQARTLAEAARSLSQAAQAAAEQARDLAIAARNIAEGRATDADASAVSAAGSAQAVLSSVVDQLDKRIRVGEGVDDIIGGQKGPNGTLGWWVRASGKLGAMQYELRGAHLETEIIPFLGDPSGVMAIGVWRDSALVALRLDADSVAHALADYLPRLAGVEAFRQTDEHRGRELTVLDPTGAIYLSVTSDGVTIVPDEQSLAYIGEKLAAIGFGGGGNLDPSIVPTSVEIDNVTAVSRRGAGVFFMGSEGGEWGGYLTRIDIPSPYAIADTDGPICGLLLCGDSTSVGGGGDTVLWSGGPAPYPRRVLMFDVGARPHAGAYVLDAEELVDFAELAEANDVNHPTYGETGGYRMVNHLCELQAQHGARPRSWHFVTCGQSGAEVDELYPGSQPYANGLTCIDGLVRIAASYGRDAEIPVAVIRAGLNDRTKRARSTLLGRYRTWVTSLSADIVSRTGQSAAPKFILEQPISPDDNWGPGAYNVLDPALAVYDLVKERSDVATVGMCYWFKDSYGLSDTPEPKSDLHKTFKGYALLGEMEAEVADVLISGGVWRGFRSQSITRAGATIDIDFWPDNIVLPLLFDTDHLPDAGNYGFAAGDDDGALTISSLSLSGLRLTITLAAAPDPAKNPWIGACAVPGPGAADRAGTWCNLRDSAALPSAVIGTRHHWCYGFKENI